MDDLRDQLDRESERFVLEPGFLDRLHRRRRRRERNRRTAAGLVALVVFGGALFGVLRALLPGVSQPSVTSSTSSSFGAIAGTYHVTLTDAVSGVRSNAMAGDYVLTLKVDGKIVVTLPDRFARATQQGVHPGGYVFRIDGDRFTTNLIADSAACPGLPRVGVYRWALSGNVLTFTAIDEPCVARRLLFASRPWHAGP